MDYCAERRANGGINPPIHSSNNPPPPLEFPGGCAYIFAVMATSRCFCTAAALLFAATLARAEEIRLAAVKAAPEPPVAAPAPGLAVPGTSPAATPKPGEAQFQPTWETQKHARTYLL